MNAGCFVATRETKCFVFSQNIFSFYINCSEYFAIISWPLSLSLPLLTIRSGVLAHGERLRYWQARRAALSSFLPHNPHNPSVLAANTAHSSGPQGHLLGGAAFCHHLSYQCTHGAVLSLTDAQIYAQDANRLQHTQSHPCMNMRHDLSHICS